MNSRSSSMLTDGEELVKVNSRSSSMLTDGKSSSEQ